MPNSAIYTPNFYDFQPSAQQAYDDTTLDAFIATKTPWGYWKLNEASGNPQDSSGNARHGTAFGSPTYSQAALTSRAGNSVRFTNSRFQFPGPFSRLGALANTWTIGGLFYIEAELGPSSPAATANGSAFFGQPGSANVGTQSDCYVSTARTSGDIMTVRSGNNAGGHNYGMQLNKAMVIFLVGTSVVGVTYTVDLYVNAVKTGQCMRGNNGNGTNSTFSVGQPQDTLAPYAQLRASNIVCWNVEQSHRTIIDVTEAMMDEAAYEASYTP